MLVGFGFEGPGSTDRLLLEGIGCDRVLIDLGINPREAASELRKITSLMRPGDTLVVACLDRLGENLDEVILLVACLHTSGIKVRAENDGVVPGSLVWEAFGQACTVLAGVKEAYQQREALTVRDRMARSRGRPMVMTEDLRNRAEKLLREKNLPVPEVARLLRVSSATIYRWCRVSESVPGDKVPGQSVAPRSRRPT